MTPNNPNDLLTSKGSAVGLATRGGVYLGAVAHVLMNTGASQQNRWTGKQHKLPGGVPFRVVGSPIRGPQCATVTIQVRDEDLKAVMGLGDRMAYIAGSQFARIYRDQSLVRVEFTLPPDQWRTVRLSELPHTITSATIGQKALGPPARIGWDPPHKMFTGTTQRSGKTTCLCDIILSIAHHSIEDYRLIVLNPKNDIALHPFQRLPHLVTPMATDYDDSALLLRHALAEMEKRRSNPERPRTRWVVIVDEIAQLIEMRPEVSAIITQLTQMAGGLGIHVIIASQSPNPSVLGPKGSLARANFGSRVSGYLPSESAWLALGVRGIDTGKLAAPGDFFAVIAGGQVTRIRTALPEAKDYANLPRADREPDWPDGDQIAGDRVEWQIPPEQLAYALVVRGSATGLRDQFPIGTDKARMIRDYAKALESAMRILMRDGK